MIRVMLPELQLTRHITLSQDSSSNRAGTAAQGGSIGIGTHPCRQHPHSDGHDGLKEQDRMKHDLLGIGSQFGSNK